MRSLKTRISIASRPDDVFQVLTDFEQYPRWNPWTRVVEGKAEAGRLVKIKPYRISYWHTLTYQFDRVQKPDYLHRHTVGLLSRLLRIDREIMIYTRTDGSAIFSASTRFSGPLAGVARFFYGRFVYRGMKEKAVALKKYCEKTFPIKPA